MSAGAATPHDAQHGIAEVWGLYRGAISSPKIPVLVCRAEVGSLSYPRARGRRTHGVPLPRSQSAGRHSLPSRSGMRNASKAVFGSDVVPAIVLVGRGVPQKERGALFSLVSPTLLFFQLIDLLLCDAGADCLSALFALQFLYALLEINRSSFPDAPESCRCGSSLSELAQCPALFATLVLLVARSAVAFVIVASSCVRRTHSYQ